MKKVHAFLKKFVSILKQAVKTKEITKNSNIEEEKCEIKSDHEDSGQFKQTR